MNYGRHSQVDIRRLLATQFHRVIRLREAQVPSIFHNIGSLVVTVASGHGSEYGCVVFLDGDLISFNTPVTVTRSNPNVTMIQERVSEYTYLRVNGLSGALMRQSSNTVGKTVGSITCIKRAALLEGISLSLKRTPEVPASARELAELSLIGSVPAPDCFKCQGASDQTLGSFS